MMFGWLSLRKWRMSVSLMSRTFFTATLSVFSVPRNTAPCAPEPNHCRSEMFSNGISQSSVRNQADTVWIFDLVNYNKTTDCNEFQVQHNNYKSKTVLTFRRMNKWNKNSTYLPSDVSWSLFFPIIVHIGRKQPSSPSKKPPPFVTSYIGSVVVTGADLVVISMVENVTVVSVYAPVVADIVQSCTGGGSALGGNGRSAIGSILRHSWL